MPMLGATCPKAALTTDAPTTHRPQKRSGRGPRVFRKTLRPHTYPHHVINAGQVLATPASAANKILHDAVRHLAVASLALEPVDVERVEPGTVYQAWSRPATHSIVFV